MVSPAAAGQPVVAENLSAFARRGPWTEKRAIELLPRPNQRKKNLPLLDEPLEDLAPIIVEELRRAIRRVAREEGLSAIVVEQHPQMGWVSPIRPSCSSAARSPTAPTAPTALTC